MKKALSILLILISFNSFSQVDTYLQELDSMDEFYRESDWKFYPDSVIKLSDSTYLMLAIPYDYNDPGAIERIVGNYVIDYVGHTFEVIDSLTTDRTITVYDKWKTGQAPQSSQIAKCYLSVMSGRGKEVGSSDYTPLEMSARWRKNGMDNERLYRHGMVYDDPFMRNVMDTTYIPDSSEVKGTTYFDSIRNNMVTKLAHIDYPWSEKLTFRAFNGTGATITKGSIVTPDTVTVIALADNRSEYKSRIIAFAAHDIPPDTEGTLIKAGQIENFNTSSYTLGAELYLGENGQMTEVEPTGGAFNNIVAVVDSVGINGSITVDISISLRTAEQNKYTGWPDADGNSFPDNVGISIDTVNRKFILYATPESEYYYYHRGQKYIHTTDTFQWSNVEGIHLMYFDGDTIAEIVNPTDAQSSEILRNNTGIVNLYWSIPQNDYIYVNNEFHTFDMNGQTKAAFYDIHGCTVIDPITLTDFDVDGTGNLNSNAQFGNAAGSIRNQDLKTYVPSTPSTTGYTIFYREGTAAWRSTSNPGYGVVNTGTGRIAYNQNVGGVHSLAEATNGSYVPYYMLVSNTLGLKYGMVPGDSQYANPDDAVAGALQKIPGFLQNLPIKAIASLAIVVYQTRDNYSNAVKGRIVSVTNPLTDETVEYIDLTEPGIIGGGVGGTGMQTLTDDPNGQPSYSGHGGSFITVNDAETGWEFTSDTKQENITLTTTGNSGEATFVGDVLNVPNYFENPLLVKYNTSSTNNKIGTNEGSYNFILGSGNYNSKSGYTYSSITGYQNAFSATGEVIYNSITGYQNAFNATGNVLRNSIIGYRNAYSATGNVEYNSITGERNAYSATGIVSRNSITGYQNAYRATGSVFRNSITGDQNAYSATGSVYRNSITGDQNAYSATGSVIYNSIMGYSNAYSATGDVSNSLLVGNRVAEDAIGANHLIGVGEFVFDGSTVDLSKSIALGYQAGRNTIYTNTALFGQLAQGTKNNQVVLGSTAYSEVYSANPLVVNGNATFDRSVSGVNGVIRDELQDASLDVDFNSISIGGTSLNISDYATMTWVGDNYEPIFSKNTAFNKNFGTIAGTVAEGNDSRILNGQAAYSWGNHALAGYLTSYTETDPIFSSWDKDYNDLINKPTLFSGSYNDLTNKPDLSNFVTLTTEQTISGFKTISANRSGYGFEIYNTNGTFGSGVWIQGGGGGTLNSILSLYANDPLLQFDFKASGRAYFKNLREATSSTQLYLQSDGEITRGAAGASGSSLWTDGGTYIYPTSLEDVYLPYNKRLSWRSSTTTLPSNQVMSFVAGTDRLFMKAGVSDITVAEFYNAGTNSTWDKLSTIYLYGRTIVDRGTSSSFESDAYYLSEFLANGNRKAVITGGGVMQLLDRTSLSTGTTGFGDFQSYNGKPYYVSPTGISYDLSASGGSGVSLGTNRQLPYMNSDGTDFLYSPYLTFDGNNLYAKPASYYYRDHLGANALLMEPNYIYFYRDARLYNGATSTSTKTGSMYFDTDDNTFRGYNGTTWVDLGAAGGGGVTDGDKGDITVSGSGTVWTLDNSAITSKTALTSGLASTDELFVSDAGILKRMDVSVMQDYMQANLSFSELWDLSYDYLVPNYDILGLGHSASFDIVQGIDRFILGNKTSPTTYDQNFAGSQILGYEGTDPSNLGTRTIYAHTANSIKYDLTGREINGDVSTGILTMYAPQSVGIYTGTTASSHEVRLPEDPGIGRSLTIVNRDNESLPVRNHDDTLSITILYINGSSGTTIPANTAMTIWFDGTSWYQID